MISQSANLPGTRSQGPEIPIVKGIEQLVEGIDALICDIWGVVHNGIAAFPDAVDACSRFRARGGTVLLLTNAPRPAAAIDLQLEKLGVPRNAFDAVLTSGDLTRLEIAARSHKPIAHIGPERDLGLFDGQNVTLGSLAEACTIVCSGLFDDERESAGDYRQRLLEPARRGVPMICANPDLTVARGDRIIECAGAVAKLYEELGGPVIYAGKPYAPVYERAFEMITAIRGAPVAHERILAIGDGVLTDIKGATNMGLNVVFVASPVHLDVPLDAGSLLSLFPDDRPRPLAALGALAW
ncbi:MAG: TIGR01459 family HAD-type hydrolase [Hyphomicrobiaceae bacterium]